VASSVASRSNPFQVPPSRGSRNRTLRSLGLRNLVRLGAARSHPNDAVFSQVRSLDTSSAMTMAVHTCPRHEWPTSVRNGRRSGVPGMASNMRHTHSGCQAIRTRGTGRRARTTTCSQRARVRRSPARCKPFDTKDTAASCQLEVGLPHCRLSEVARCNQVLGPQRAPARSNHSLLSERSR
jgi:hypothetical protein